MRDHPDQIPSLTEGQLQRAIYSNWDFQQALSALTFLMEDCDFDAKYSAVDLRRFRCYETSIIVSFSRPFEKSRGSSTLSLKALGVKLEQSEQALYERVLNLRRKVVAHSDEEYMHYLGTTLLPIDDSSLRLPHIKYSESLHLAAADLRAIERLLHRLIASISDVIFKVAQHTPYRLERYKNPPRAP